MPSDTSHSRSTPALRALDTAGIAYLVHAFDAAATDAAHGYGKAAAEALGLDEHRVFKTLLVAVRAGTVAHAVAIVPVAGSLSLRALARVLGAKSTDMADVTTAQRLTGYVVGGISPLGQRTRLTTVIDESALNHATIYVSAGKRGLDVEVAPQDVATLLSATFAAITEW